jgi:ornithine carbamoyltransferase
MAAGAAAVRRLRRVPVATPATSTTPLRVASRGLRISARNLRRDQDLTAAELRHLLTLTGDVKRNPKRYRRVLDGEQLALLFEKPSLRTRLTFELAAKQLGGDAVTSVGRINEREPVKDVARNLGRWTRAIVARTFSQQTIDDLAHWSGVPVVNALSDLYHPCQALADVFTLTEKFGSVKGLKLAFIGDGNNVAHSLMLSGARLGMKITVATPEGYEPSANIVEEARGLALDGGSVTVMRDPVEAVQGAAAVYTDVWASMGQESEADERKRRFTPYQVNSEMMQRADGALFMHCLPAKRGQEATDEVIESPNSVVFDQAENRLHAQKALLVMLLGH